MKMNGMKKITSTLLAIICLSGSLLAQDQMLLDEHAQVRPISASFTKIDIAHNIQLVLSQSDVIALAVSAADEKFISDIKTEVVNDVLKISRVANPSRGSNSRKYIVYLSFRELSRIKATGAATIVVLGAIKASQFSINLSGASEFRGKVRTDTLFMDLNGASEAKINGMTDLLDLRCTGASDFDGYNLIASHVNVELSGASDAFITANKWLAAKASGASNLYYKGAVTQTELKKSGVSEIKRTDENLK
jgi:hypothetical protein